MLRYGVIVSFVVIAAGLALLVLANHASASSAGLAAYLPAPDGQAAIMHTPGAVVSGLSRGDPSAVVVLGLVILLATPVLQVASSAINFTLRRDWTYVAITAFVLTVLVIGFLVGAVG